MGNNCSFSARTLDSQCLETERCFESSRGVSVGVERSANVVELGKGSAGCGGQRNGDVCDGTPGRCNIDTSPIEEALNEEG